MSALLRLPLSTHPEGKVVGEVHGGVGVYSIVVVGSWTPVPLSTHPEGKVVGEVRGGVGVYSTVVVGSWTHRRRQNQ
jgi:hypothetical protein